MTQPSKTRVPLPTPTAFTPEHARAALAWLDAMGHQDQWDLTIDQQTQLLGGVKRRTYQEWKRQALAGQPVELARDTMERLSLLLGLHKALRIIAPNQSKELAVKWFSEPNTSPIFGGLSIKDYLLTRGTMDALYTARRYLDAARG